ncbi:MAG: NF038122 family metalloprotease [Nostocaceae cyanobacterium]|nr:NF038122 family metalloprotease [Nostocaceae cyanobacterium]
MKNKVFKPQKWYLRTALALAGVVASSTSALAANFNFSYQPGTTHEQIEAFELAGQIWSSYLTEPGEINIHVAMTDILPLGGATPALVANQNYTSFRDSDDVEIFDDIHDGFNLLLQNGTIISTNNLMIATANAKSLMGVNWDGSGRYGGLDGFIQMNKNASWHYDYTTNVSSNKFDFVTVALHEIGHTLGFISGVERSYQNDNDNTVYKASSLDLFRYSQESADLDAIDFRVGSNAYFSLDEGNTNLGNFAEGVNIFLGGDGFQAPHWKVSLDNPLGIMDPLLGWGTRRYISTLDLQAFDAIGWDINYSPELDMDTLLENAAIEANEAVIADKSEQVEAMIEDSEVYKQDGWCDPIVDPNCGWWQSGDAEDVISVPEPSAIMGLLGLLGISVFLKGRSKNVATNSNNV